MITIVEGISGGLVLFGLGWLIARIIRIRQALFAFGICLSFAYLVASQVSFIFHGCLALYVVLLAHIYRQSKKIDKGFLKSTAVKKSFIVTWSYAYTFVFMSIVSILSMEGQMPIDFFDGNILVYLAFSLLALVLAVGSLMFSVEHGANIIKLMDRNDIIADWIDFNKAATAEYDENLQLEEIKSMINTYIVDKPFTKLDLSEMKEYENRMVIVKNQELNSFKAKLERRISKRQAFEMSNVIYEVIDNYNDDKKEKYAALVRILMRSMPEWEILECDEPIFVRLNFIKEATIAIEKSYEQHGEINVIEVSKSLGVSKAIAKAIADSNRLNSVPIKTTESMQVTENFETRVVDINTCSQSELAKVPGLSSIMVMKAMKFRNEKGGFENPEEFFGVITAKPHNILKISGYITCSQKQKVAQEIKPKRLGRKVEF